ncbi:MAG: FAD:protein FMN transferase [Candidatus Omnitrophica bacterium]|nr:FAD:protein FMN transferase [Candidatus Omnitrophota bacterium]MDD5770869.1 FAD:protein FMN transferase [Candidatus Omnitrophota bacterium]
MPLTPKTRKYLIIFLILGWGTTLGYLALRGDKKETTKAQRLWRQNRLLMGTFWEVTSTDKDAADIVFSEAGRIEKLLSKYIPESEISQLNRKGKLEVSPDTFYIIKKAKELWEKTGGAFDITVAPLVDIWGFSEKEYRIPSEQLIKETLRLVGCDKIILHEKNNVVKFMFPGMKIDLGAIAKGFALDKAVAKLKKNNIRNCLINAGGQVYALGEAPAGKWKVAIQDPRKQEISRAVELKDASISTSGDYEQFFFKNGRRYCHILNPKKGYPAESGIASVTVIDNSGLKADALSTAALILGREGLETLKNEFPEAEFLAIKETQ